MPKRCCCIIPLRGGVVISGFIMLIISVALLGATFAHKNPMVIHLSITHVVLPWVYIGFLAGTAVVSLFVIIAGISASFNLLRLTKFLIWFLVFFLTIWQAICFIFSLVNRSKSLAVCKELNPKDMASTASNSTINVGDYTTTILDMKLGSTYGLANCDQAVQADVIGSAIMLFVGQLFMFYAASVLGSYVKKLKERKLGHRLRDLEIDNTIDDLASTYRKDARNAPKYPSSEKSKKGFFKKFTKK